MKNKKIQLALASLTEEDLEAVRIIEKQCFGYTWPQDQYAREIRNTKVACYLTAKHRGDLTGFVGAWMILDEVHITTIAVSPEFRGYRIGKFLLWSLFDKAVKENYRWSTLEVNIENPAARHMYEQFGFEKIGERKDYYGQGKNAIVMWTKIHNQRFKEIMDKNENDWKERICLSWE
ncbi:MAG: ribosomal protein S18-alanine N-acetyltransferase [Vulcanimicrobiota bacterium]